MNDKSCGASCGCDSPSKSQYILIAVLIAAGLFYFAGARSGTTVNSTMPGLVIYNGMGMGGLGRLDYDEKRRAYVLLDGRFTPFVVEGENVRPMRVDEGGGAMAIPKSLASIDGAIYGHLPSYNAIMKITPDSKIDKLGRFGAFAYGGGNQYRLDAHNGNLFFFEDNRLMAFSPALEKLGEVTLADIRTPYDNYVLSGDSLYYFESEDTAPYTDCVILPPEGTEPTADQRCGERFSRMVTVDIANPAEMRVTSNEKRPDENPARYTQHTGYDAQKGHWLLAGGRNDAIQLRLKDSFNSIADSSKPDGTIHAVTPTAPFYMLRWNGERMVVNAVSTGGDKISIGPDIQVGLTENYEDARMKRHGDHLFITARSYLRVLRTGETPEVVLMQDFRDDMGDRFQFADFTFGDNLPQLPKTADKDRLGALLKLDYISRERRIELQSEVEKLTPDDEWALPLLTGMLEKQGSAVNNHALAVKGLGNLGAVAVPAIPALLEAAMVGAGVRSEYVPHLAAALKRIDPEGTHVAAALPQFVAGNYTAGAKSVARQVLEALPGDAAKAALKDYE